MITCEFKTNSEEQNNELTDSIWEAIQHWMEYERRELLLCKWVDKEGYHVAISADDKAKLSASISFKAFEETGECYELILKLDSDEKTVLIPGDVIAKVYYEKTYRDEVTEAEGLLESVN